MTEIMERNIHQFDVMQREIDAQWLEKSNYCAREMGRRTELILNKLS